MRSLPKPLSLPSTHSGLRKGSSSSSSPSAPPSFVKHGAADGRHVATPSAPPVFIQRLIVLHESLMPIPPSELLHQKIQRRRKTQPTLSEDASLDEHGEFILYYYNHSLHFSRDGVHPQLSISKEACQIQKGDESNTDSCKYIPPSDHATEDAVRFAGICRALRSLPQALQPQSILSDGNTSCASREVEVSDADVVYLTDSTLIFVPLELGGDIIAIAQIPRAKKKLDHSQQHTGFGADPSAIAESMRHIHSVFSLMFDGGIHRRLLRTKHLERSNDWVIESIYDTDGNTAMNYPGKLVKKEETIQKLATRNGGVSERLERSSAENLHHHNSRWNLQKLSTSTFNPEYYGKQTRFSCGDYRYGGIEELFNLRREHRKLMCERSYTRDELGSTERWNSSSHAADLLKKMVNDVVRRDWEHRRKHCEHRIHSLLRILPLTKLRADLTKHYDQWLFKMQELSEIIHGGVGRCVVNMVPSPIWQMHSAIVDAGRGQHPPYVTNPLVYQAAVDLMKSIMYEEVPKLLGRHVTQLSGMSFFDQNRHILSEFTSNKNNDGQKEVKFPAETSCMIVEYFRSNQKKCKDDNIQNGSTSEKITENDDNEAFFVRWMSNLSTRTVKTTENSNMHTSPPPEYIRTISNGSYVEHPSPISDADGGMISVFVQNIQQHVWLQRVHLPLSLRIDATDDDEESETYVAMFEHPEFSFLLFFDRPITEGDRESLQETKNIDDKIRGDMNGNNELVHGTNDVMVDVLYFLADKLTMYSNAYSSYTRDPAQHAPINNIYTKNTFLVVAGMDIICIDIDKNSFILISQHDLSSNDFKRMTNTRNKVDDNNSPFKAMQKLFSNSPKLKERGTSCPSLPPPKYSNILDCRHKLAAYLPLEVMHALDDMFNELRCSSEHREMNASRLDYTSERGFDDDGCMKPTSRKSKEICTYLPQGWVWGRSCGNIELYMILDTNEFATIHDVQKAVARVQDRLIQKMN